MTVSTIDELRSLGQRVYDAINAKDLATLERLFAADIVRHAMGEVGFEAARRTVSDLFATAPDTHFHVEDLVAEGDRVAVRVTVHRGAPEPGTIPQSILEIFRIEHGRVAEIWGCRQPSPPRQPPGVEGRGPGDPYTPVISEASDSGGSAGSGACSVS